MIKLEHTDVYGFDAAVRGMRNPLNSWDKSDSAHDFNCDECAGFARCFKVGENDLALMRKLAHAGDDHGKFGRFINVTVDITAPFKATVEKAYKNWYLLVTATGYHTTIMRNAVGVDWEVKRV